MTAEDAFLEFGTGSSLVASWGIVPDGCGKLPRCKKNSVAESAALHSAGSIVKLIKTGPLQPRWLEHCRTAKRRGRERVVCAEDHKTEMGLAELWNVKYAYGWITYPDFQCKITRFASLWTWCCSSEQTAELHGALFDVTAHSDTPFSHFALLPSHILPFSQGDLSPSLLPRTVHQSSGRNVPFDLILVT